MRLFEGRFRGTVYRPIGLEWFDSGYWKYSANPGTVHQYLDIPNGFEPDEDGVVEMPWAEGEQPFTMRGITLDGYKRMDLDYMIGSVIQHESPYVELVKTYHPKAVYIREMGNIHDTCDFTVCRNVLNSTMNPVPEGVNTVVYNQEFSLEDYRWSPVEDTHMIKSFLHVFPETKDYSLWLRMKAAMPDFKWMSHGALCTEGNMPSAGMPEAIRSSSFVAHLKWWGDGFGHTIHNSAACGKPIITRTQYFDGMMAGRLLEDGITCVNVTDDLAENARKIRYYAEPERYRELSQNMYNRFKQVVDFDADAIKVKEFLQRCTPP